jgi:hypothetical protein
MQKRMLKMPTNDNVNGKKDVKLKTFIITPQFEQDMEVCRDFDTTDAKIIRNAVRLYRLVREGKVKIVNQS